MESFKKEYCIKEYENSAMFNGERHSDDFDYRELGVSVMLEQGWALEQVGIKRVPTIMRDGSKIQKDCFYALFSRAVHEG